MATTQTELKSSFLKDIVQEGEYQSNVKALQDWLTGATQAATQQYQATAQTAAEQASYDISGAYANYLKQQRAVAAQGQLESGHKEEIGNVLQQQYQGAYSQARTAQAQTVAKAQEQYGENISYATQMYEKDKQALLNAAIKEADARASIFKAAEQYAGLMDYTQNITPLGADIRDASGNVIGTGKGIYDIDAATGEHTLTKYGTNVFRQALLQDEGFKNYLEEKGLTDELDYYLSDITGLHKTLFGFTETDYGISEASKKAIAEATLGTEGYAETIARPEITDYIGWYDFTTYSKRTFEKQIHNMTSDIEKYADDLGLTETEIKSALDGKTIDEYLDVVSDNVNKNSYGTRTSRKNNAQKEMENMYKRLIDASRTKHIKE
jgi:multidrug efflux pump subunit AcrA (membrane-fusion protein)